MIKETKDPFWYYRLARVQYEKDHFKSALSNINLALKDSTQTLEYAKLKAEILLSIEDYNQIDFLKGLADKDMTIDQASSFAELAIRGKDEPLYLKFLSKMDNQTDKYLYLQALHYYHTGEKIKAIAYLDKSIQKNPTDSELFQMYIQMISNGGDLVKVNQVIKEYRDTSSLFFKKYYGLNLYELDSIKKATQYLNQVMQKDTLDYDVNIAMARLSIAKYNYDRGIKMANRALEQRNSAEAHYLIALGKKRQRLYHRATEHLDIAKSLVLPGEKLYDEILKLERNIRYLQSRKIQRDTTKKVDSIQ